MIANVYCLEMTHSNLARPGSGNDATASGAMLISAFLIQLQNPPVLHMHHNTWPKLRGRAEVYSKQHSTLCSLGGFLFLAVLGMATG